MRTKRKRNPPRNIIGCELFAFLPVAVAYDDDPESMVGGQVDKIRFFFSREIFLQLKEKRLD
jgi:hypothetical protein